MSKFVFMVLVICTFTTLVMLDPISREQIKSHYIIFKAQVFGDYSSLAIYLNKYHGEAASKVKYLNVGLWAKENKAIFRSFLAKIDEESCTKLVDAINLQLFDIGETRLPNCHLIRIGQINMKS